MNAAQMGIATTEHNIANATTPGFSRQQIVQASRAGQSTGTGFVGAGVDVSSVKRIYDQFLNVQVLQEQNQASYLTAYTTSMRQIDNLVADPAAGVSPALQSFFDAMNAVSNNPESLTARQTLLGSAQFAVNRFQAVDQRLTDINNSNVAQIGSSVTTINTYAVQIATLNGNIKRAIGSSAGQQPNDLIDQRDQAIKLLNQEIKTSTIHQPDGTVSVFIGNGQALVINEQAMNLQTVQSDADPSKLDIAYLSNGITTRMQQSSLQGGNLGAYLTFRDQSLEPARNALGRVALGLASSMNQQNRLGQDLNGAMGGNLFNMGSPRVDRTSTNTGTAVATAAIGDVSALTTSDYLLKFNGAGYTMQRLSDNAVTNLVGVTGPFTVDGFTVSLTAGAVAGDSFLIRPTVNGARDISLATVDPAKIAAALPLRAAAAISATTPASNVATVAGMTVSTPTNVNLTNPVTITFTGPLAYTVTGAVPAVVGAQVYNPLSPSISYNGWTMQLTGAPTAPALGDVFNVSANSGAAKVSSGAINLNPVSINFTSATAYNVVEMRGVPPSPVTLGSGLIPPAAGGSSSVSYNGWTVAITGVPAANDVFNVTKGSQAGTMLAAPASTNGGSGVISGGTLSPQPFTIVFNNPATSYTVSGATPPVVGPVAYTAGQEISYNGWTMQVTGTPVAGDVFSFATNSNAVGDNRNALMLATVQTQNLLANGTVNLQGAYSQLVGQIGVKTNELTVTSLAQNNMVTQSVAAQQAVSGVNLDEEAANLMQYQKAYQAAAKAMQIASTMFDALLAIGR